MEIPINYRFCDKKLLLWQSNLRNLDFRIQIQKKTTQNKWKFPQMRGFYNINCVLTYIYVSSQSLMLLWRSWSIFVIHDIKNHDLNRPLDDRDIITKLHAFVPNISLQAS